MKSNMETGSLTFPTLKMSGFYASCNKSSKPEEPKYEYRNIPFAQIPQELLENNKLKPPNPQNPQKPWEIKTPKGWEREIEGIDYTSNSIMLEDGTIIQYPALDSKVTIRKEIIPEKS
jgi:hypothetical protein